MDEIIDPTANAAVPPAAEEPGDGRRMFFRAATVALCIAGLYFARDVMIPVAVAVLISFILTPLVKRLQRWGLPRIPAVILTVAIALAICLGVLSLVVQQMVTLAGDLPKYEQTYRQRVESIRSQSPSGLARAIDMLHGLGDEVMGRKRKPAAVPGSPIGDDQEIAIPVEVRPARPTLSEAIDLYIAPAVMPLLHLGIMLILVIFLLLGVDDLRDRLLRVIGRWRTRLTENAINEAGARVSGYLLMQFINNVIYGAAVALGLWAIGLPGAALWGLAAFLVRFIPYVGPWLGTIAPILLSLGVFNDWTHPVLVILMFVVLELLFNNVIEPYLFGKGAGISPIAVIVSLIFWGWLWDGVGLLVAVPLTACLVVAGRYLPPLEMFAILMSDDPAKAKRAVVVELPESVEEPPARRIVI